MARVVPALRFPGFRFFAPVAVPVRFFVPFFPSLFGPRLPAVRLSSRLSARRERAWAAFERGWRRPLISPAAYMPSCPVVRR